MMQKHSLVFLTLLLVSNFLFAQVEYFVRINPATCSYTIIDSLPGVKWIAGGSAFDKINKRYIFHGQDINLNDYLYSIDAVNGNILSNPQWINYWGLMEFDNATGILYGIHWNVSLANADFVSINPTNLTYTIINQINLTGLSGDVTFDDINHRFIFIAYDSIGNNCLFCIDAITGNIISKPPLSNTVSGIRFDNSSGTLYGLQWDNSLQTEYFASINIANGNTTIISSIPLVNANHKYSTFDEINKRYTFVWTDSNNTNYLYSINATDGLVVSNPAFPVFVSPYNLLEFRYDNSSGNLYALHWGPYFDSTAGVNENNLDNYFLVYPNPAYGGTTVTLQYELPKGETQGELILYNTQGAEVKRYKVDDTFNDLLLDNTQLQAGTYFYQLTTSKGRVGSKKMVVVK